MNKEDSKKLFGRNVRKIRELRGMSQEELAHKMGFKSRSSINKIEIGRSSIPVEKISQLALILRVSPLDFIQDESEDLKLTTLPDYGYEQKNDNVKESKPKVLIEFNKLSEKNQEQALSYIKYLLDTQKGEDT